MDSQEPLFLINGVNYTKLHNACQYSENPRNRDSHKAVPIAVPPHRLIATEVTLGTPPSPLQKPMTLTIRKLTPLCQ